MILNTPPLQWKEREKTKPEIMALIVPIAPGLIFRSFISESVRVKKETPVYSLSIKIVMTSWDKSNCPRRYSPNSVVESLLKAFGWLECKSEIVDDENDNDDEEDEEIIWTQFWGKIAEGDNDEDDEDIGEREEEEAEEEESVKFDRIGRVGKVEGKIVEEFMIPEEGR